MALIVGADVMEIEGRGMVCLAELDEYPDSLHFHCTIGGEVFKVSPVHIHWDDPSSARPIIGLSLEGRDLPAEWFVGRQVSVS